ncbi:MAG TPA: hypothetical protein VK738_05930 [Terriglobales bacterium]|jgi:hypothetical protein|nr:hypothetical protein [Terriglobales bacterium]
MKNFTQKALMIVITLFVLVGLFYGLSTPVKATSAASLNPALPQPHDGPVPTCAPMEVCATSLSLIPPK